MNRKIRKVHNHLIYRRLKSEWKIVHLKILHSQVGPRFQMVEEYLHLIQRIIKPSMRDYSSLKYFIIKNIEARLPSVTIGDETNKNANLTVY